MNRFLKHPPARRLMTPLFFRNALLRSASSPWKRPHSSRSTLSKWMAALEQIPTTEQKLMLSPEDEGSDTYCSIDTKKRQDRHVQALMGDKLLGVAVTTTLLQQCDVPQDTGSLTGIISYAVSNHFLAQHVHEILPNIVTEKATTTSEWEMGTTVEAAISAVHKIDPLAVNDLAEFLLDKAASNTDRSTMMSQNKSLMLELGGTITSERTSGSDHNPVFTATAILRERTAAAFGPSKKRAELLAATKLLFDEGSYAEDSSPWHKQTTMHHHPRGDIIMSQCEWTPFLVTDTSLELADEESPVEWWIRGASIRRDAFRRAMFAPIVFPDTIQAVDSWVRRCEEEIAVFGMIVTADNVCYTIPVETSTKSATQARQTVGIAANRIIAKLTGTTPLPLECDDVDI